MFELKMGEMDMVDAIDKMNTSRQASVHLVHGVLGLFWV